jgi:hypothetical protein
VSMWVEKGQVSNSERMVGLGSIRPICRAIGEDPICALLPLILVTRLFRHRGLKDDLIATGPLSDEVLRLEID